MINYEFTEEKESPFRGFPSTAPHSPPQTNVTNM